MSAIGQMARCDPKDHVGIFGLVASVQPLAAERDLRFSWPMSVEYPISPDLPKSPFFSAVAVIPAGASLVLVGGQNAVDTGGKIVGTGDLVAQAQQTRLNVERALRAAGCTWADVVRISVYLKAPADPRAVFGAFQSALTGRGASPLVGVYQVTALAHPDFLIEVGAEAVLPRASTS